MSTQASRTWATSMHAAAHHYQQGDLDAAVDAAGEAMALSAKLCGPTVHPPHNPYSERLRIGWRWMRRYHWSTAIFVWLADVRHERAIGRMEAA